MSGRGFATLAVQYTFDNTYSDSAAASPDGAITVTQGTSFDSAGKIGTYALRTEGLASPGENKARWAAGDDWLDGKSNVSMSFWLRPDVATGIDYFFGTGSSANNYWCFRKNTASKVDFYFKTSSEDAQLYSYTLTDLWKSSQWTHLTMTWSSASTPKLYVWGKEVTWTTNPGTLDGTALTQDYIGIAEGRTTSMTDYWDGRTDDVGLWDEVIGAKKVAVIHGLGEFEGQNLGDADIDGMVSAFNSASDYATDLNQWYYVDGLTGSIGDIGGTVGGGDAYIVLDGSGNGMSLLPEPATVVLLGLGGLVFCRRRR